MSLEKDARAAKKAGVSYGQWKAMQPPTLPKRKLPQGNKSVCEWCGKEFYRNDNRKCKFCGDYCRLEANKEKERARKRA